MRDWIPKIHQQSITQVLRDMPVKAADDVCANPLILAHHLAQFLRIELLRERRGAHEVTKHDGQLPTFSFGSSATGSSQILVSTRLRGLAAVCIPAGSSLGKLGFGSRLRVTA